MKLNICKIILFLFLTFGINLTYSQPVTLEWVATISQYNASPQDAVLDSQGNIYITGGMTYTGQGNNYITIKFNSSGVLQWLAMFNGPPGANSIDIGTAIDIDNSGNVYVTGSSERAGLGSNDYCTIKYNSQGVQQWVRRYTGTINGENIPADIEVDNSENIYVFGYSTGINSSNDYCLIKYNVNGDSIWVRRYNGDGNGNDIAKGLTIDNNNNVYVTGYVYDGPIQTYNCCTIKYAGNGTLQWIAKTNENPNSAGNKILIDQNQNVLVCGSIDQSGIPNYLTIKYNQNGNQQWIQTYNGPGNHDDIIFSSVLDNNNNIFVTGLSYGSSITKQDFCTIKYNTNGDSLWVKRYNGPLNQNDVSYSITSDNQNNVYITGSSPSSDNKNMCTIKYNSEGVQQWLMRYNGIEGSRVLIDSNFNVYVIGRQSINFNEIITVIKYSQLTSLNKIKEIVPQKFDLYQNFPNPFNNSTIIKFDISEKGIVELKLYDIEGKETPLLLKKELDPGNYNFDLNADNLSSGIYFYVLSYISENNKFSKTKKLILTK